MSGNLITGKILGLYILMLRLFRVSMSYRSKGILLMSMANKRKIIMGKVKGKIRKRKRRSDLFEYYSLLYVCHSLSRMKLALDSRKRYKYQITTFFDFLFFVIRTVGFLPRCPWSKFSLLLMLNFSWLCSSVILIKSLGDLNAKVGLLDSITGNKKSGP